MVDFESPHSGDESNDLIGDQNIDDIEANLEELENERNKRKQRLDKLHEAEKRAEEKIRAEEEKRLKEIESEFDSDDDFLSEDNDFLSEEDEDNTDEDFLSEDGELEKETDETTEISNEVEEMNEPKNHTNSLSRIFIGNEIKDLEEEDQLQEIQRLEEAINEFEMDDLTGIAALKALQTQMFAAQKEDPKKYAELKAKFENYLADKGLKENIIQIVLSKMVAREMIQFVTDLNNKIQFEKTLEVGKNPEHSEFTEENLAQREEDKKTMTEQQAHARYMQRYYEYASTKEDLKEEASVMQKSDEIDREFRRKYGEELGLDTSDLEPVAEEAKEPTAPDSKLEAPEAGFRASLSVLPAATAASLKAIESNGIGGEVLMHNLEDITPIEGGVSAVISGQLVTISDAGVLAVYPEEQGIRGNLGSESEYTAKENSVFGFIDATCRMITDQNRMQYLAENPEVNDQLFGVITQNPDLNDLPRTEEFNRFRNFTLMLLNGTGRNGKPDKGAERQRLLDTGILQQTSVAVNRRRLMMINREFKNETYAGREYDEGPLNFKYKHALAMALALDVDDNWRPDSRAQLNKFADVIDSKRAVDSDWRPESIKELEDLA